MFILQEKKAHENWVAARQAERRLTEVIISTTGQLEKENMNLTKKPDAENSFHHHHSGAKRDVGV